MPWIPNTQISRTSDFSLVFNVQDYGALGNGTHDDAGAINAAITAAAAAGGGVVYFPGAYPSANYAVASTVTNPGNVLMLGQATGTRITAITPFPNDTPVIACDQAGIVFAAQIKRLSIDCNSKTGSVGIYMNNTQENSLVEDVIIYNYGNKAIWIENASDAFAIRRVGISTNLAAATAAIHLNACPAYMLLEELSLGGNNSLPDLIHVEACANVDIRACLLDGSVTDGIDIDGSTVMCQSIDGGSSGITNLIHTRSTTTWVLLNITKDGATNTVLDSQNGRTYTDTYIAVMVFGDYKYANWSGWTVTNPVTNRSLDVTSATLGDVRQVLGSVIADLKTIGLFDA